MSFVSDYGQFGRACRVCDHPDECDDLGYCPLDLPSGHTDEPLPDGLCAYCAPLAACDGICGDAIASAPEAPHGG